MSRRQSQDSRTGSKEPPLRLLVKGRRTAGSSSEEGDPRVPSDEASLCTVALRQRQGAGKGGGARGGVAGRRVAGTRPPREPRARSRKPSPEGEAGSLRANGERRRRPGPTPALVGLSQSRVGQLRHSWAAPPRSRARLSAAAEEGERSWAAASPLGGPELLVGKAVADFGGRC